MVGGFPVQTYYVIELTIKDLFVFNFLINRAIMLSRERKTL
jgi:hypothetical protein